MQFYPDDAVVPAELRTDEFHLRPLRASDAEIDYAAVMDSREMLRILSQSDWPSDTFTLEMNRKDLEQHEQEHEERTAFTYTVLDPTGATCLGCVYVEQLKEGPMGGDCAAQVQFWVRQPYLEANLDRRLLASLIEWFRNDWAFSSVVLTVADADARQTRLATDLGLPLVHTYGSRWSEYLIKGTQT
jgi:hypothetical protein